MTERINQIRNYKPDHSTYGGLIYFSDFNTNSRQDNGKDCTSSIASRIFSDWKFDNQCRNNAEGKNNKYLY